MKEIRVLDCTLRDGGYCNDCQFGFENTKFIIDSLLRSGVDIIECGFLTQKVAYKQGVTRFNTLEQVKEVLPQDRQGKTFVILMDYGACDVETIPDWDGSSVDGIRVTFHKKDMLPALEQCRRLKEKGYKTFLRPWWPCATQTRSTWSSSVWPMKWAPTLSIWWTALAP